MKHKLIVGTGFIGVLLVCAVRAFPSGTEGRVYKPIPAQEKELEIDHGLRKVDFLKGERHSEDVIKAEQDGALGAITLKVVDQTGHVVSNATVQGGFYHHGKSGYGFKKTVGANGLVELKNRCVGDMHFTIEKDGYYKTSYTYRFLKAWHDCAKNGRWIPWNPTVEVILKRKVNPVAMYAFDYTANYTVIPKIGEPLGFDLMAGDWVAPNGTGKTPDFKVTYFRDGEGRDFTHQELVLTADGPFAGFMKVKSDTYSAFKSPHHADTNDVYTQELRFTFDRPSDTGRYVDGRMTAEECIVFRSRTRIDKDGRLVGAHYGKIYGPLKFATSHRGPGSMKPLFYLNPTENDTNLEYDPRRNLLYPKARNSPP